MGPKPLVRIRLDAFVLEVFDRPVSDKCEVDVPAEWGPSHGCQWRARAKVDNGGTVALVCGVHLREVERVTKIRDDRQEQSRLRQQDKDATTWLSRELGVDVTVVGEDVTLKLADLNLILDRATSVQQ